MDEVYRRRAERDRENLSLKGETCDGRCPAAALVKVRGASGELMFCGHHASDFDLLLSMQGFRVVGDLRPALRARGPR